MPEKQRSALSLSVSSLERVTLGSMWYDMFGNIILELHVGYGYNEQNMIFDRKSEEIY